MTVSLAAVFIPLVFMSGIVGRLLHEFAVTIVMAILISGFISITLTPMLCANLLRSAKNTHHSRFYEWSENLFGRVEGGYKKSLAWGIAHGPVTLGVFALSLVATVLLFMISPEDFIPSVDTGQIQVSTQAADRTSFGQMTLYQQQLAAIISKDPNVFNLSSSVANGFGGTTNTGSMQITLKPTGERHLSADQIIQELRPKLARVTGINAYMQNPPSIRIGGMQSKSSYQYTLQDTDQNELQVNAVKLMNTLSHAPGFADVTSDMDLNSPSLNVTVDRDKAAQENVSIAEIESALGTSFGGQQISTIYASDAEYWVMLELLPQYQNDISGINALYISANPENGGPGASTAGASASTAPSPPAATNSATAVAPTQTIPGLIPVNTVVSMTPGTMPLTVNHLGQLAERDPLVQSGRTATP